MRRLQSHRFCTALLVGALAGPIAAQPLPQPEIVSPGSADRVLEIEGRCPTFNWAGVPDARSYELRVYLEGSESRRIPVIESVVSGNATGWTPSADLCLEAGRSYSWYVRGHGEKGSTPWSAGGWFKVANAPSPQEVVEALDVLRRYLDEAGLESSTVAQSDETALLPVGAGDPQVIPGAALATPQDPAGAELQLLEGSIVASGLIDAGSLKAGGSTTTGTLSASGLITSTGGDVLAGSGMKIGFRDPAGTSGSSFEEVEPGVRVKLNGVVVPGNSAVLEVYEIEFNRTQHTGSTVVRAGGGTGFFEIGSALTVDVDNNTKECLNGGVVVGFRFKEQPTDQLAFDLICTQ